MAVMWEVIVKKLTVGDQLIEDLGIVIPGSGQVTLSDQFTFDELAGSDSLRDLVAAGTVVVNDGTSDLSDTDGVLYLTFVQADYLAKNHYTKAELVATGGSNDLVDWSNVANAPAFGTPEWQEPVSYRVLDILEDPSSLTPATGDIYIDTDDDHYYKWDGAAWQDEGAASDNDRVVNLSNSTEDIYKYDLGTTTWVEQTQSTDNTAIMVGDDGDGKAAQYIYVIASTVWVKIADVDFEGHFDGGVSKHDASEIDVEGTYDHIATGGLEAAIEDIDDELTAINAAIPTTFNTLNAAYDEGGSGVGRIITADAGPVELNRGAATSAAFCIVPKAGLPTTGLADGQLATYDGLLWIYDATRTSWLSVTRHTLVFGKKGPTKDQMLAFGGGSLYSNLAGYRLLRNATITGLSGQLDTSGSCTFQMRKNSIATTIASLAVAATTGNHDASINVDLTAGEYLQSYLTAATPIDDPVLLIEIAWRA